MDPLHDTVDEDLLEESPGGHHKIQRRESDFRLLVDEIHQKGRMFKFLLSLDEDTMCVGTFVTV